MFRRVIRGGDRVRGRQTLSFTYYRRARAGTRVRSTIVAVSPPSAIDSRRDGAKVSGRILRGHACPSAAHDFQRLYNVHRLRVPTAIVFGLKSITRCTAYTSSVTARIHTRTHTSCVTTYPNNINNVWKRLKRFIS